MAKGKKLTKKQKKLLKIAGFSIGGILLAFFVVFMIGYAVIGTVFFNYALDATFAAVTNAPTDMVVDMPVPNYDEEWFNAVEKEEKYVVSDDGYNLHAYFIAASEESDVYVITIHGYRGKSTEMGLYAHKFHDAGFNVLMPDLKGHGESEGKYIGMGYLDRFDILKWIDLIIDMNENAKIVLHGVSMGAATVMSTTGEELPKNVVCAIEDCGYTNVYDQFIFLAKTVLKLPLIDLLMSASDLAVRAHLQLAIKDMDITSLLKKSVTPTMFIHGTEDNFVPFYMLDELYNANATIEKEKLEVEGASHAYSATLNPDLYFDRVLKFINKYIV